MSGFLQSISIKNFKAFEAFEYDIAGKNILLYGPNGSGKSSLYYSLYTFLESAGKQQEDVAKYFDGENLENLLHRKNGVLQSPGKISLGIGSDLTSAENYKISAADHDPPQQPILTKGNLASDFITYRFFFGFSDFRNSENFNIWPLFEKEMMPFAQKGMEAQGELYREWQELKSRNPNPNSYRGVAGRNAYRDYNNGLDRFCQSMEPLFDAITIAAQSIYDQHFTNPNHGSVKIGFILKKPASYNKETHEFTPPQLELEMTIDGNKVPKPQSFLNEAKMTQIALAFRLGATQAKLSSDLQLLVVDDLLVSLDMENRGAALKILLGDDFKDYQKLIFTHELGFFEEAKRQISQQHCDWKFLELKAEPMPNQVPLESKNDLQQAQDFLTNNHLAECGNRLRKHAEACLTSFLAQKKSDGFADVVGRKKFASLHKMINEAKNEIAGDLLKNLQNLVNAQIPDNFLARMLAGEEIDPSDPAPFNNLSDQERGRLTGKIKSLEPDVWNLMLELFTQSSRDVGVALKILDDISAIKDRILNPASHAASAPIYQQEAEDAINVIHQLQPALKRVLQDL